MKLFSFGAVVTVGYFLILSWVVVSLNLESFTSWNELGDFLAGAFSPVAFLWLVLGYLQQQKELQQNTKALEMQSEELRNSVDQYKAMVEVARDQLNNDREYLRSEQERKEREIKPDVGLRISKYQSISNGRFTFAWSITSDAHEARNVVVNFEPAIGEHRFYSFKKLTSAKNDLSISAVRNKNMPSEVAVTIKYESILGKKYEKKLYLHITAEGNYQFKTS